MRTFLLDPNSLLEFLLNRSNFIGKVEYLSTIFRHNSGIQLYLSQPGLDKIVSLIKPLNGLKKTEQLVTKLKKRIKILRLTKAVAEKAKSSSINYDSAVEIHLAIKKNIDAIVTHQPDKFSSEKLSIIRLSDLQLNHLELSLAKNINELPAILVTPIDKILNLNKTLHIPSYIAHKSLKPKKNTRQLNPNYSSNKLSSPTGKNLSPLYIDRDRLLIKSFACSTAYIDIMKSTGIAVAHVAENPFDKVNKIMLEVEKTFSLAIERLSIKPLNLPSFPQLESRIFGSIGATALQAHENLLGGKLMKDIFPSAKIFASAVDSLSIRSSALQSIGQLESTIFGGITATALQSHESTLDTLKERIAPVKLILCQK